MASGVTAAATGNTDTDMMEDGFVLSVRHSDPNFEKKYSCWPFKMRDGAGGNPTDHPRGHS